MNWLTWVRTDIKYGLLWTQKGISRKTEQLLASHDGVTIENDGATYRHRTCFAMFPSHYTWNNCEGTVWHRAVKWGESDRQDGNAWPCSRMGEGKTVSWRVVQHRHNGVSVSRSGCQRCYFSALSHELTTGAFCNVLVMENDACSEVFGYPPRSHDWGHLVVECWTKTTLSYDNLCDLTACYLPRQQPLSTSFPTASCIWKWNILPTVENIQLNILPIVWLFFFLVAFLSICARLRDNIVL